MNWVAWDKLNELSSQDKFIHPKCSPPHNTGDYRLHFNRVMDRDFHLSARIYLRALCLKIFSITKDSTGVLPPGVLSPGLESISSTAVSVQGWVGQGQSLLWMCNFLLNEENPVFWCWNWRSLEKERWPAVERKAWVRFTGVSRWSTKGL